MKNTFLSMFVALLLNLGIAGPDLSYSDLTGGASKGNRFETDTISRNDYKNGGLNRFSAKAVRHFERAFRDVSEKQWYILVDGTIAYFTIVDVQKKAAYDESGNWLHTLSFYQENKLPTDVRRLVKREYYDYTIYLVVEIEKDDAKSYMIKMQNSDALISVMVWEDEMMEIENYRKSFEK